LRHAKRVAVGRWDARGKSHIATLRAQGDVLVMQLLRYRTQIRAAMLLQTADVKPAELKLALAFINANAHAAYDPEAHEDVHAMRLQAAIDAKAARGQVLVTDATTGRACPVKPGQGAIATDLAKALKASLAPSKGGKRSKRA
jgi:non-homologous end joining protein Ku